MASLRKIQDSYFARFLAAGWQFERDVDRDPKEADATLKHVETTVLGIPNGRTKLPAGADIAQCIESNGEATEKLKFPQF